MMDLIKYVVLQFADHKDDCEFVEKVDGDNVSVTVYLNPEDMGRVIGRQGRIAKALRTIVKSAAVKTGKRYNIEICEKEGA